MKRDEFHVLLLVSPPAIHRFTDRTFRSELPYIGLAYIAASLRQKTGVKVTCIDCRIENMDVNRLVQKARELNPHLIGITAETSIIENAAQAVQALKTIFPNASSVIGGPHASASPRETLDEFPCFDFCVVGEGEETVCEIVDCLRNRTSYTEVPGLAFRQDSSVCLNPPRPWLLDIDSLPMPALDLFPMNRYRGLYYTFEPFQRAVVILTARGCPFKCSYCPKTAAGGPRYRMRSVEGVLEEIQLDIDRFAPNQLVFLDANFTLNYARTMKLLDGMLSLGVHKKVRWICQTRPDLVDLPLLMKMKEANCMAISYGIESGDQYVLDRNSKDLSIESVMDAISWTKKAGIAAIANFILGLPYDTEESIKNTINLAFRLAPHTVSFSILVPYPGTTVWNMVQKGEGGVRVLTRDWLRFGHQVGGALSHENISRHRLEKFQRNAYLQFYLRPQRLIWFFKAVDPLGLAIFGYHHIGTLAENIFKRFFGSTNSS